MKLKEATHLIGDRGFTLAVAKDGLLRGTMNVEPQTADAMIERYGDAFIVNLEHNAGGMRVRIDLTAKGGTA